MNDKWSPRLLIVLLLVLTCAGCASPPQPPVTPGAPIQGADALPCTPTDQDRYVWRASRLQLIQPCARAVGTVVEIAPGGGADGDIHIDLRLDPPYQGLLNPVSQKNSDNLVIEAVCQFPPPMMEALRLCASDPDPYLGPFPREGDHVWMEGRHVLDLQHSSQAELHPLYRWGIINP